MKTSLWCLISFLIVASARTTTVQAASSNEDWAKVEKSDGMGVTYVHRDSLDGDAKSEPSTVSIYRIPAADADIVKFKTKLSDPSFASPAAAFAPAKCFSLTKDNADQTWCEASAKWFVVSVEMGAKRMAKPEIAQLVREKIAESAK